MKKDFVALKPCPKCQTPVGIHWIAGMSRELALACRHPYGGRACWYIKCPACGYDMNEGLTDRTAKGNAKAQAKLIRRWNA